MMASEKPSGAVPRSSAMTRQRCAVALEPQHGQHAPRTDRPRRRLRPPARRAGSGTGAAAGRRGRSGSRRRGACWRRRARGRPRAPLRSSASGLNGGRPQFWPCGPRRSGGAPTESACGEALRRATRSRSRRGRRRPRGRGRGRRPCRRARARSAAAPSWRVGEPLQPGVEGDALGVLARERAPTSGEASPERLRPVAEPGRALGRGNARTAPRRWRAPRAPRRRSRRKASKAGSPRAVNVAHSASSSGRCTAQTAGVVDERGLAQRRDARWRWLVEQPLRPRSPRSPGPRPGR